MAKLISFLIFTYLNGPQKSDGWGKVNEIWLPLIFVIGLPPGSVGTSADINDSGAGKLKFNLITNSVMLFMNTRKITGWSYMHMKDTAAVNFQNVDYF